MWREKRDLMRTLGGTLAFKLFSITGSQRISQKHFDTEFIFDSVTYSERYMNIQFQNAFGNLSPKSRL